MHTIIIADDYGGTHVNKALRGIGAWPLPGKEAGGPPQRQDSSGKCGG